MKIIDRGNIFESEAEVITNATNSIGVMGAGLALAFIRKYPLVCGHYNIKCAEYQLKFDKPVFLPPTIYDENFEWDGENQYNDKKIMQFPSMVWPGELADINKIKRNLYYMKKQMLEKGCKSVALPALGCGIGRLPFEELVAAVEEIDDGSFEILLYSPR